VTQSAVDAHLVLFTEMFCYSGAPIYPFCDRVRSSPIRTECSPNLDSVAVCNLVEYHTELPSMYQVPHCLVNSRNTYSKHNYVVWCTGKGATIG